MAKNSSEREYMKYVANSGQMGGGVVATTSPLRYKTKTKTNKEELI